MSAGVWIAEGSDDLLSIDNAAGLLRDRLPLSRSFVKADVSVCRNSSAVHDEGYASLMSLRVEVVESHSIDAFIVEVSLVIQLVVLRIKDCRRQKGGKKGQKLFHSVMCVRISNIGHFSDNNRKVLSL